MSDFSDIDSKSDASDIESSDSLMAIPPRLDRAAYTTPQLSMRLEFAEERLREAPRLSPRALKALIMYRDAAKQALAAWVREEIGMNVVALQVLEAAFDKRPCLVGEVTEDEFQLDQALVRLREASFFSRYGDYISESLHPRQVLLNENHSGHSWTEMLPWTDIGASVQEEHAEVRKDLWSACDRLSFNHAAVLQLIETAADGRLALRKGRDDMVLAGDWSSLAKMIQTDLVDLPMAVGPDRMDERLLIKAGIEQFRHRHFTINAGDDPRDPASWQPTNQAIANPTARQEQDVDTIREVEERR